MKKHIAQEIIRVAKILHAKNMLAAADGNISYRINDQEILITPSGKSKANLSWDEMAVINVDNQIIKGTPSSERLMHLAVYRQCPKASCVIHAHPPRAIAWTITQQDSKELPGEYFSELILATGRIPIAPYNHLGVKSSQYSIHLNLRQYGGIFDASRKSSKSYCGCGSNCYKRRFCQ